ncbi:MAG: hypothetical protein ACJA09_002936 [Alcanivorax sp.]|jgi:hypothetical protein
MDVLGMDPVAEADARVIEVNIVLDEVESVSFLTNLQVEVEISPKATYIVNPPGFPRNRLFQTLGFPGLNLAPLPSSTTCWSL